MRHRLAPLALGVALFSLALNAALLLALRSPERWTRPLLEREARRLADEGGTVRFEVRLPAGTPLRLDVPVDERFRVRVDTVIPIRTNVRVPVRSPFGTVSATVPIHADVPVRTALPLHIRHTFRLRTRTQEQIVIPIQLDVRRILEPLLQ